MEIKSLNFTYINFEKKNKIKKAQTVFKKYKTGPVKWLSG